MRTSGGDIKILKCQRRVSRDWKGVYFPAETDSSNISVGAERIRRMRNREKILEELCDCRFPGRLFVTAPTNHRQHPGRTWAPLLAYARQCLLVTDVYTMYQIPKLYRIALSSFAFRVRISSSVLLQSSRSR